MYVFDEGILGDSHPCWGCLWEQTGSEKMILDRWETCSYSKPRGLGCSFSVERGGWAQNHSQVSPIPSLLMHFGGLQWPYRPGSIPSRFGSLHESLALTGLYLKAEFERQTMTCLSNCAGYFLGTALGINGCKERGGGRTG